MTRRREAAELARVLQLSTQEAITVSHLSPHTLSSNSRGTTQDSKDMELRAVHQQPRWADQGGQPPAVRTLQNVDVPRRAAGHVDGVQQRMGGGEHAMFGSDPIVNDQASRSE